MQDRFDRHVQRGFLRLGAGMSRFQASHALEEALRLVELPGEAEGRQYYFQHVSLMTIPAQATRRIWIDRLQRALLGLADNAVHGADPRAPAHAAVYFDHREQVLETLLRRLLRAGGSIPWFLEAVLDAMPLGRTAQPLLCVIEALQHPEVYPPVGAAIIWSSLGHDDSAILLDALPHERVRQWIDRVGFAAGAPLDAPRLPRVNATMRAALESAARRFGWLGPHTVWLAAQAEQVVATNSIAAPEAMRRARTRLRQWAQDRELAPGAQHVGSISARDLPPVDLLRATHTALNSPGRDEVAREGPGVPRSGRIVFDAPRDSTVPEASTGPASSASEVAGTSPLVHAGPTVSDGPEPSSASLLGEPTAAAGLFFLLYPLRRLGISQVVAAHSVLADGGLAAQVLRHLASCLGVKDSDPILQCLGAPTDGWLADDALAADSLVGPAGWATTPRMRSNGAVLVRAWSLAVRRWCWRNAGIAAREVVTRGGRVWLTRAELDVTLPHDAVDIRIRRSGLDLDPGWLPWLGPFGRVVRFHYRHPAQHG